MKLSKAKIRLAMARACIGVNELPERSGVSLSTIRLALAGKTILPATAGKLAKGLGVDVTEIIE